MTPFDVAIGASVANISIQKSFFNMHDYQISNKFHSEGIKQYFKYYNSLFNYLIGWIDVN